MPAIRRSAIERFQVWAAACLASALLLAASPAHGDDPEDVDQLIEVIRAKPSGMDRAEWKERRREAAKKLGKIGDKRAVPVLIEVVETEEFDVIAEHAIEALGELGDDRAVPALRKVYDDKSRDRYIRSLAEKALESLGVKPDETEGDDDDDDGGGLLSGTGGGDTLAGGAEPSGPEGPPFEGGVLGATEHLTLAAGAATLRYDTIRDSASLDGHVSASYGRSKDRRSWAYRYDVDAEVSGGAIDYDDPDADSKFVTFSSTANAETRFYMQGSAVYGLLQGGLGASLTGAQIDRPEPATPPSDDVEELRTNADLHAGLGVGYGRILDVGEGLRLRRIEQVLRRARVLGRPITPDLAERIMLAWWSLRGEVGAHERLTKTVAMLREAGVLLGEPDASTAYEILQVLLDGQLDHRLQGLDVHLGVAESFVYRDDDTVPFAEDGRIETVLARARYGKQAASAKHEILGEGTARYRILGDDTDPAPWALSAAVAWRHYRYSRHYDPIGALEIAMEAGLADDGLDDVLGIDLSVASRIAGRVGWIWSPNRASTLRAAVTGAVESGEIFLGMTFEATYGLLDVGFVGPATYRGLGGGSPATSGAE